MPELAEVETIACRLRGSDEAPVLPNRRIAGAELFWERTLARPCWLEFLTLVENQSISAVSRRGKFLVLQLSRGSIIFHLRMTGDLLFHRHPDPDPPRFTRFLLRFSDGSILYFTDARKFGRVWFVGDSAEVVGHLGIDALDVRLNAAKFYGMLHAKKRMIKPLLLDQHFLAGLGNIYTDESLHRAGIHPRKTANRITFQEANRLLQSIQSTLKEAVARNGSSIDWAYRGGEFQNHFQVYGRKGETCQTCGGVIMRDVIGQRGTYFCAICQSGD